MYRSLIWKLRIEVLRDGCSDGVTREENKLIPKQKSSEDVHSHKLRVGRLKQVIAQVPETREVYEPGDRLVREFRQITMSEKACAEEKIDECNEPEKASVGLLTWIQIREFLDYRILMTMISKT